MFQKSDARTRAQPLDPSQSDKGFPEPTDLERPAVSIVLSRLIAAIEKKTGVV